MTVEHSKSQSLRTTVAVYGLLAGLSLAAIVALRGGDKKNEPQTRAPISAAPVADAPAESVAVLCGIQPASVIKAERKTTVVRVAATSDATEDAVSFPGTRVAQTPRPIELPPPPVAADPTFAVLGPIQYSTQPAVAVERIAAAPVVAPPSIGPPPFDFPPIHSPPPVDAAPQPEPYRLGAFTQNGTITPADVRAMALRSNKEIAVIGQTPHVAEPLIAAEAGVFDPVFNIALNGGRYNQQTSSLVQSLGTDIPVLKTAFWQPINGLNQAYVEKLFKTGGKLQAGLGQTYLNYSPAGDFVFINPAYQASFNVSFEQPLFRGRGPAATTAPIMIAKANHEQSRHAFRAIVNQVLRDAENAYWETYAAYQDYEVRDLSYRQAMETLQRERGRLQLGEGSVPDVAQAEEQATAFEIARTDAENRLVMAQRTLRRLMGLAPGDLRPVIPATPPSEATVNLDWDYATTTARARPEVAAQRAAVAAVEFEMARRRNGLQPDLSLQAIYSATGLDDDFGEAWGTASEFAYNSWTAGVVYKQPLGRRTDRALAERAAAALALESARLRQVEHEVLHQLDAAYQNVQAMQRMLELHRRRREAAAVQLTARRELYLENRAALRDQLDAEVRYASALYDESLARVNYQRALTDWNFARGAMIEADVALAE